MKKLKAILLIAVLCGLSGCATTNKDPLEGINRGIYKFNDVADKYAMKPVAKAYKAVAPEPVRTGISNFFSNLGTLTTIVNDLLQLKFAQAFSDAGRFVINSTFGIAGFIDVASKDNIPKHNEDFGQTLGYWGVGSGAYLVLPILGPSSVRDTTGLVVDVSTSDPITYLHNIGEIRTYNQIRAVQLVDRRTQLLDAKDLVDDASIDPYAFMRDAYLQRRASMVQDGLVPADLLQDDGFEPDDEMPADKSTSLQQPAVAETVVLQSSTPIEESVAVVATEAQSSAVEEVAVTEANVAVVAGESAEAVIAD
jgi:phospholipid-binding lipoprotein MlaA